MNKDALKILAFTNGTASHIWRFDPIARRFNARTKHEMAITDAHQWNNETLGADLVVVEMIGNPEVIDTCHNLGAKVIYEADDAVVDTYGKERKNLTHVSEGYRKDFLRTIAKADAVTVTNEKLAENYKRFTDKPIYVLPILMDYDYYKEAIEIKNPERNTDEIRIGWFGGKSHFEDLRMVLPSIKRILERYPEVKFVYCGYGSQGSDRLSMEVQWGEDVFKEIPRHRREFHPGVPEDYWKFKHRFLDLDIGLAPLIDDAFNDCKEPTKWLEYSALETPVVASPTVYGNVIEHGRNGLLAKTEAEWEANLDNLIRSRTLRKELGKAAAKDVFEKYNIENVWQDWEKTYQKVVAGV